MREELTKLDFQSYPIQSYPISGSTLTTVLIAVILIAALYFGREVLVPIALAVLLSFVLAPPVRFLQRWYVPRGIAVIVVALVAFAAIFGLGALMVAQVTQLAGELPSYQSTLREKIQSLRGTTSGTGTLERASEVLQDLSKEIEKPNGAKSADARRSELPPSADSSRGEAARSRRPADARHAHHAADRSADDHRHRRRLRGLHPDAAAGFAEPAGPARGRAGSPAHDRGARRCRPAPQPPVPDPTRAQCGLRPGDRIRTMDDRRAQRPPVGHAGDDHALRAVCRRADLGDIPARAGRRRRTRLDHGAADRVRCS